MISRDTGWVHGNGLWSVANGELNGEEDPAQKHVAAAVWRASSRMSSWLLSAILGAKSILYRFDAAKGHLGGFVIEPGRNLVVIPRQNYTRTAATPRLKKR